MALEKSVRVLLPLFSIVTFVSFSSAADPLCEGLRSEVIHSFPHETSCSLYYECFNGDKATQICPDYLYYNPTTKACGSPELSGCKSSNECEGVQLDYLPVPGECNRYIECYKENSYLMSCPTGYYFDSVSKMCVPPDQSDCQDVNPPWTTPVPLCNGIRPNETVLSRYPGDCRLYWRCYGSQLSLDWCQSGLFFDAVRQLCDFPVNVDCDDSTRTPDPSSPTPPTDITVTPIQEDPRCADSTTATYWTHPVLCTKYIECLNGHSYEMDCPPGLYFSDIDKQCVNPRDSECGKVTVTEGTTPSFPPDWTADPDCPWPGSEGKLLPFPDDCTKFYECAGGVKVELNCPANLWFSIAYNECVYPYQSGCTSRRLSFLQRIYKFFAWY